MAQKDFSALAVASITSGVVLADTAEINAIFEFMGIPRTPQEALHDNAVAEELRLQHPDFPTPKDVGFRKWTDIRDAVKAKHPAFVPVDTV